MKYIARGSVFFSIFALMMTVSYFQPTAEAALVIANNSRNIQLNIQQILQQDNSFIPDLYVAEIEAALKDEPENADEPENSSEESNLIAEAKSFRATAYCLRGKTATGSSVRRGIVAADPRILPLGTRIEINAGSYSGTYTVADTGGAVRGRILDIWVPSCGEAKRFGRKKVMVSVLKKRIRKS